METLTTDVKTGTEYTALTVGHIQDFMRIEPYEDAGVHHWMIKANWLTTRMNSQFQGII